MIWLLRLFPAFRALKSSNRQLRRQCGALERESETLRATNADLHAAHEACQQQIAELIEKLDGARTSEIESTRLVADQFSFMRFGRTVYGRGDTVLPIRPEDRRPIEKTKLQASDIVRMKTMEFKDQMIARQKQQAEEAAAFFDSELAGGDK